MTARNGALAAALAESRAFVARAMNVGKPHAQDRADAEALLPRIDALLDGEQLDHTISADGMRVDVVPSPVQYDLLEGEETVFDDLGRCWTIITKRAVVGFQWWIYCHSRAVEPIALEAVYPGGVAHGWTDDDHDYHAVQALLESIMTLKGATKA